MYNIQVLPSARKDLDSFDKHLFDQVADKIHSLESSPRPFGCVKLTGEEGYRIRSGNYRILYRIDDKNKVIFIYRVKHRKESYR
jgi:mRNA interferase RelE/StbE